LKGGVPVLVKGVWTDPPLSLTLTGDSKIRYSSEVLAKIGAGGSGKYTAQFWNRLK
jgi:hypothetical protein